MFDSKAVDKIYCCMLPSLLGLYSTEHVIKKAMVGTAKEWRDKLSNVYFAKNDS